MYIPFNQLPSTARLWVYAAPRPFSAAEIATIKSAAPAFIDNWSTHGTPLQASFDVLENQFLLMAVDEGVQTASGCSIDSSVGFVRGLEQQFGLSLTDRSLVYFLIGGEVKTFPLTELKQQVTQGNLSPETKLINTLVATKEELTQKWLIPAGDSWLKRYFKKATA